MKKISLVLVLSLMLSGCASYGPVKGANYEQLIKNVLPPEAGAIKMSGTGTWYRDAGGVDNSIRKMPMKFAGEPVSQTNGIVAITETALYFLQWYKETGAYKIMLRIRYDEIQSLQHGKLGSGRRIAIQEKDFSFTAVDFSLNGFIHNEAETEEAFRLLQEMIKTSEPSFLASPKRSTSH